MKTLEDFREWTKDLPDDYEIWIEYPKRYGLTTIGGKETEVVTICDGEHDCIQSLSIARDDKKRRVFILHHF